MRMPYTKSGKCGKVIWQKCRWGGQVSYRWKKPRNPRTQAQQSVRTLFGSISSRWQTLTEDQRQVWIKAGRTKKTRNRLGCGPMPGYNYFVKINVMLAFRGQPQVDLPPEYTLRFSPPVPRSFLLQLSALPVTSPARPPKPLAAPRTDWPAPRLGAHFLAGRVSSPGPAPPPSG
jgi:hypothetical protein